MGFLHVAKNVEGILNIFELSYPFYSQIWLNYITDDHEFNYITNMKKNLTLSLSVGDNRHIFFFLKTIILHFTYQPLFLCNLF